MKTQITKLLAAAAFVVTAVTGCADPDLGDERNNLARVPQINEKFSGEATLCMSLVEGVTKDGDATQCKLCAEYNSASSAFTNFKPAEEADEEDAKGLDSNECQDIMPGTYRLEFVGMPSGFQAYDPDGFALDREWEIYNGTNYHTGICIASDKTDCTGVVETDSGETETDGETDSDSGTTGDTDDTDGDTEGETDTDTDGDTDDETDSGDTDDEVCGNGMVEGDEACDDGNTDDDVDGCNSICEIDEGWTCDESEPSVCEEVAFTFCDLTIASGAHGMGSNMPVADLDDIVGTGPQESCESIIDEDVQDSLTLVYAHQSGPDVFTWNSVENTLTCDFASLVEGQFPMAHVTVSSTLTAHTKTYSFTCESGEVG